MPVYATMFALVGFPAVAVMVGLTTAIQTLSPASHLGRVYAAYDTSSTGLQAVGVLAAGALADRIGVAPILDVQSLIYVACGRRRPVAAPGAARLPATRSEPVRP